MAIARKPTRKEQEKKTPGKNVAVKAQVVKMIKRGNGVPTNGAFGKDRNLAPVLLRIPADILDRLNHVVESRTVPLHRTTWILEAIVERLERGERASG